MSDEEKKAIERLIIYKDKIKDELYPIIDFEEEKAIGIILNLIEKQSKEIEELKEKNKTLKSLQNDTNGLYIEMTERKNYFERELQKVEDKIKAKIEEYEKELNKLLQKEEWLEPHDTIKRNKYMHYIEFGQSLLEKE